MPFCRRIQSRQASQMPVNRLHPATGAILPLRFVVESGSPSRTLHSILVTRAPSASAEEFTARKSRQRW